VSYLRTQQANLLGLYQRLTASSCGAVPAPLLSGDPKWWGNFPEGSDFLVIPCRLEIFIFCLAVYWWIATVLLLSHFFRPEPFLFFPFSHFLIFLLLVSGNVHPPQRSLVRPTSPCSPKKPKVSVIFCEETKQILNKLSSNLGELEKQ